MTILLFHRRERRVVKEWEQRRNKKEKWAKAFIDASKLVKLNKSRRNGTVS